MITCEFPNYSKGAKCSACGTELKRNYVGPVYRPCGVTVAPAPCPHLGPSTGESVLIFGCGCSSSKTNGIEVTVFECDIHNRCVTYSRGNLAEGSTMKRCLGCADNPVNRNPAK